MSIRWCAPYKYVLILHVQSMITVLRCFGIVVGLCGFAAVVGCHSFAATVHIVPSDVNNVSLNLPLMVTLHPSACYYWVNDDDDLCIAMHGRSIVRGLAGQRSFDLSLVLGDVPAGASRAYRAIPRTMRSRTRHEMVHTRLVSSDGVVSVWQYGSSTMHGRFKLNAIQQSFMVLTGWGHNKPMICLGDFEAQYNPSKGIAILERTEQQEMKRPPLRNRPIPVSGPDPSMQSLK